MPNHFYSVPIIKKENIYYEGQSISYLVKLVNSTKTLKIIIPKNGYLTFKTYVLENIEIISEKCNVEILNEQETKMYSSGKSFNVPSNSQFRLIADELIDYICHLG